MIRYHFQSAAELERHLRLGDGVFFVPDLQVNSRAGERVVVEIVFPHTDDTPMVHGRLLSVSREGVWLEAPAARAAARWVPGPDSPRRREKRLACDLFVEVHSPDVDAWLCRALDISESGLRLATGSFETGLAGDEIDLTLLPRESEAVDLRARLAWAGSRAAGFQLLKPVPLQVLRRLCDDQRPSCELDHSAACPCATGATGHRQP